MPIVYRKLRSGEANDYRRVRLECLKNFPDNFGSSYADEAKIPRLKFEAHIENDSAGNFMFGAFDAENLIGIAGISRADRAKTGHRAEIVQMYVNPQFRGRKIGENLLKAVIEAAFEIEGIESLELSAVADNISAVGLYEKLGFEIYGRRQNYFKENGKYWNQVFMDLPKERFLRKRNL